MSEKAKGKMQEAAGAVTGDEGKKAEGQARQRKVAARVEREQHKRTKAERAEKSRKKQERKNKGGLLGNL
ncbi:MAG: CsbD family protein [Actinomycetota bacterium]|nr:CsbD family protein [Actinomycetota bacterium]